MTNKDLRTIILVAFSFEDIEMIELVCFTVLQSQIGGRANETSTRLFSHLDVVDFINENQLCKQFQLHVRRDKNARQQDPRLFAQADNDHWFKDFYFLLAMLLLFRCSGACSFTKGKISNNYPIFPLFYSKHQKDEEIKAKSKNNKSSSLVSHTYNFLFGRILKRFAYPPKNLTLPKNSKLNPDLTNHGNKKYTAQKLANLGMCAIWILYRLGLLIKSVS